jgi:hypothetical protein
MVLLYIVNRLRLKVYFEIKWSKLKIKQYYISSKCLSRGTGDDSGFLLRMAALVRTKLNNKILEYYILHYYRTRWFTAAAAFVISAIAAILSY